MLPGFKPNIWEVARQSSRPRSDVWLLTLAYIGHITWVMNLEPCDNQVITTITYFSYNYRVMKLHHWPVESYTSIPPHLRNKCLPGFYLLLEG
jgi:hypothetical protein